MTKDETQTGLDWIRKLENRAKEVAYLVYPNFGKHIERVSFDESTDYVHAEFTLKYDCEWYEDLPMCYLWMDESQILSDVAERKRKKLEAKRLKDIEESELKIQQLRAAATDLAKEEARLAKLKEQA